MAASPAPEAAMRVADRYDLAKEIGGRYREAGKKERGQLLDAFCLATGYHRKHASAVLRGRQRRRSPGERRPRRRRYGKAFTNAITVLWEASGYVCAERLRPWLPELARLLEQHRQLDLDASTRQLLITASLSTVERTLHQLRRKQVGRRMTQTKPGTLLRREIPVIVGHWKEQDEPGYVEIDLVSHSGEIAAGKFLQTLSVVDICTGWSERISFFGKHQETVVEAMVRVQYLLPFDLKGIHPDNGSEFINHLLVRWCRDQEIVLARGRPYRKNDNPHVEQKNWTLVRRIVGYDRLDTPEQLAWMNSLYTDLLRPFANCFQPTMKLIGREQVNNHTRRLYDVPTTPLQRVIDSGVADPHKLAKLRRLYASVSPLTLKRSLDRALIAMPTPNEEPLSA
jgi:hypothetical protein